MKTPYITQQPGGGGSVKNYTLTLDAALPDDWTFPALAYHHLPENAVYGGSVDGWWIVEFRDSKTGVIYGRSAAR